jgi:hypothetical protein
MNKLFENTLTTIIGLALIWGEFGGLFHSYKKHSTSDVFLSFFIPPVSWYRSVEFFWHDDYANVDWDEKINNDIGICIYFFNGYIGENPDIFTLNTQIEAFGQKISDYPDDKYELLKQASKVYMEYLPIFFDDFINSLRESSKIGIFKFNTSKEAIRLEKELIRLGYTDIDQYKDSMLMLTDIEGLNDEEIQKMKETFEIIQLHYDKIFSNTYKSLFKD